MTCIRSLRVCGACRQCGRPSGGHMVNEEVVDRYGTLTITPRVYCAICCPACAERTFAPPREEQ